jgi:tRNA A37 threonylcarbamoyladenosine biosynthesis protein TsaE
MILEIESLKTINETAGKFIDQIGEHTVFAFNGKMGAGKTDPVSLAEKILTLFFP